MKEELFISDLKLSKLAQRLSQSFRINEEEAMEVIYEEWDLVEELFHTYANIQVVQRYFVDEINYAYRIA